MIKKLMDYQEEAVNNLVEATENLLENTTDKNKILVFQSPTGSGKTVMMAKYIEELSELENEMNRHKTILSKNEVIVANWEKLRTKDKENNWTNIYMRDGERTNFREVLENTTKSGRKVILIIDESHYGADTDRTKELKEIINAEIVVEVSATPKNEPTIVQKNKRQADMVYVDPSRVIEEGMIKKRSINQ